MERTKPQLCPACGHLLDAATLVSDSNAKVVPVAGDLTVCMGCARPLLFEDGLRVRTLTQAEAKQMQRREPRIYRIMSVVSLMVLLSTSPEPPPKPDA